MVTKLLFALLHSPSTQLESYFTSQQGPFRAQGRLLKATPLVATIDYPVLNKVADYSAHPLFAITELKPDRLARLAIVLTPMDVPPSSTAASDQNEEWLSAMVDTVDEEMVDVASDNLMEVLMQGVVHQVCQDVN
ncbi:hypothetical protein Tco_0053657 [Tanacetum coccineum]